MDKLGEIISKTGLINRLFPSSIDPAVSGSIFDLLQQWKDLVGPEVPDLAIHCTPVNLKNGSLYVEVDHPGWIQLFMLHQDGILNRVKAKCPGIAVSCFLLIQKGKPLVKRGIRKIPPKANEKNSAREGENLEQAIEHVENEKLRKLFASIAQNLKGK